MNRSSNSTKSLDPASEPARLSANIHWEQSARRLEQFRGTRPVAEAPRLGSRHVMLWIAMVGIYLSVARFLASGQPIGLGGLSLLFVHALVGGAAWSGLLIFSFRRWGKLSIANDSGEWLLAILGARLLLEVVFRFRPGELFSTTDAIVSAWMCCLLVFPTTSRSLATSWKIVFSLLVIAYSLPLVLICTRYWFDVPDQTLSQWANLLIWSRFALAISLPVFVSIWHIRRGERFGWMHWTGLLIWVSWLLLQPRWL